MKCRIRQMPRPPTALLSVPPRLPGRTLFPRRGYGWCNIRLALRAIPSAPMPLRIEPVAVANRVHQRLFQAQAHFRLAHTGNPGTLQRGNCGVQYAAHRLKRAGEFCAKQCLRHDLRRSGCYLYSRVSQLGRIRNGENAKSANREIPIRALIAVCWSLLRRG